MKSDYLLLGVIGKPVLHSRSPQMHNAALSKLNIPGHYLRIAAKDAKEAFEIAKIINLRGINVTAPFKEEAFELSNHGDALSTKLRAANTLLFENETRAFNTDVEGVLRAFMSNGVSCEHKKALVLGAGAAARAALCALRSQGATATVVNRTFEKAKRLANEFGAKALCLNDPGLKNCVYDSELIVACLSTPEKVIADGLLKASQCILDSMYKEKTALVEQAQRAGAKVINGLEWLIYQGALAFEHFTSTKAPIDEMRKALESAKSWESKKSIALIGMMGAGKSSIGRIISEKLCFDFVDLDEELEKRQGMKIREIIDRKGEASFRNLEASLFSEYVESENVVFSCGGGLILRLENRNLLKKHFLTIWIHASEEELASRVAQDINRPLLSGYDTKSRLKELFLERRPFYAEVADLFMSSQHSSERECAERIMYEIRAAGLS
ncbi:MAG: hypothetical protein GYA55_12970 [SAR324 cluster bacterium]|uniref:Shikimate kinase n=1 Tax=SAR324 cluster bacterium TaxID=2024889 RepID=A0A7X9FUE6_9DELT|nr:hypothetical protein [SAR324 cluster bacterium]